jgi:hypothetical protein
MTDSMWEGPTDAVRELLTSWALISQGDALAPTTEQWWEMLAGALQDHPPPTVLWAAISYAYTACEVATREGERVTDVIARLAMADEMRRHFPPPE